MEPASKREPPAPEPPVEVPVIPADGEKLRDQRVAFFGTTVDITTDDVAEAWEAHRGILHRNGYRVFPERMGEKETLTWIEASDTLSAFVGSGRWIAICPHCNGGIALWKDNPQAACLDCGRIYSKIKWPDDYDSGVQALEARPNRMLRFWDPEQQPAKDLHQENADHSVDAGEEVA